jgi:hypothetical protein
MANLIAVAYDAAGNTGRSATVAVNVSNALPVTGEPDTTAPVVTIINPVAGAVAGTVAVSVSATDNLGAAVLVQQLLINGNLAAQGTGGTLSYNWNTRKLKAGMHTIKAVVRDAAGNSASSTVSVSVR